MACFGVHKFCCTELPSATAACLKCEENLLLSQLSESPIHLCYLCPVANLYELYMAYM